MGTDIHHDHRTGGQTTLACRAIPKGLAQHRSPLVGRCWTNAAEALEVAALGHTFLKAEVALHDYSGSRRCKQVMSSQDVSSPRGNPPASRQSLHLQKSMCRLEDSTLPQMGMAPECSRWLGPSKFRRDRCTLVQRYLQHSSIPPCSRREQPHTECPHNCWPWTPFHQRWRTEPRSDQSMIRHSDSTVKWLPRIGGKPQDEQEIKTFEGAMLNVIL